MKEGKLQKCNIIKDKSSTKRTGHYEQLDGSFSRDAKPATRKWLGKKADEHFIHIKRTWKGKTSDEVDKAINNFKNGKATSHLMITAGMLTVIKKAWTECNSRLSKRCKRNYKNGRNMR